MAIARKCGAEEWGTRPYVEVHAATLTNQFYDLGARSVGTVGGGSSSPNSRGGQELRAPA